MSAFTRVALSGGLFAASAAGVAYVRRPVPPPAAVFPSAVHLGEQVFGAQAVGRFQIANAGGADLVLSEFTTSCSCAGVEADVDGRPQRLNSLRLAQGEQADLSVRVAVGAKVGTPQNVHVGFTTNDPRQPSGVILVSVARVRGGSTPSRWWPSSAKSRPASARRGRSASTTTPCRT